MPHASFIYEAVNQYCHVLICSHCKQPVKAVIYEDCIYDVRVRLFSCVFPYAEVTSAKVLDANGKILV